MAQHSQHTCTQLADATSVGDPSGAAVGAHLGGSVPSQRHKALWWEGSHNPTQHSQLNAGSSSCAQLMLVYSRESWLSLQTPAAVLTESPPTTAGTQMLRLHLDTQR